MTDELHVLVYGVTDIGACSYYRFEMYREALARLGVIVRQFVNVQLAFDSQFGDRSDLALAHGEVILDREQLDWADVVVFARHYQTAWWRCTGCIATTLSEAAAINHAEVTGHVVSPPDPLLRPLFDTLERNPDALRGRALLYEADDDLLHVPRWNIGPHLWMSVERDLVERMARRADLVTVSTPVLAAAFGEFSTSVRVVRNAIDPSRYPPRPIESSLPGDPRLLYYGAPIRIRDYGVCRDAVDATKLRFPDVRRVWLGATGGDARLGSPAEVIAAVDETLPYVPDVHDFAEALVAARPDIGLAPVVGDDFDRAKSELHWLEYSMAGAATVASRTMRGGPYDVIRSGVDGLLARSKADWRDALAQLVSSPSLREDLAGRARERVITEYHFEARAVEWADAYRWAAEHAGRGATGRQYALGSQQIKSVGQVARLGLDHRRRVRQESAAAPGRLAELRGERATCWSTEDVTQRLVSVVVPVGGSSVSLVERALRSVLRQDYPDIEAVVAGAPDPSLSEMIKGLSDQRVRLVEISTPPDLPTNPVWRQSALEAAALAAGAAAARGSWIAPLGPEAEFTTDHVSLLLGTAIEHGLEFVYGQVKVILDGVEPFTIGSWPPISQGVLTLGSELYSARLNEVASYDPEAWRELGNAPWTQWSAFISAGVRMANAEAIVATVTNLTPVTSA